MSDTCDRVDKWLWAVRLYKTRPLATEACRSGHVRCGEHVLKPARDVRVGDVYHVRQGVLTRVLRVVAIPDNRVGAPRVPEFMEDLTPPEDVAQARAAYASSPLLRARGAGRPTKRDRRALERHFQSGE